MNRSHPKAVLKGPAPSRRFALVLVLLCMASAVYSASIQVARLDLVQAPDHLLTRSTAKVAPSTHSILERHGDHDDEEQAEHQHDMSSEAAIPLDHSEMDIQDHDDEHTHVHEADHTSSSHKHEHEHQHGNHDQEHAHDQMDAAGPSPASIPDAAVAGSELRDLPIWHAHKGHSHSHSHSGPVLEHLNETLLFRAHGPDPLSYIEWDFGYGLGSPAELRRFTSHAEVLAGRPKMAVVDNRWRKLLDEQDVEQRQAIAADIASRLPTAQNEAPSRHGGLLMLHVVTAVLSCFVLLPMVLVLRAAHSALAPLASLVYLALLGGSMFLSVAYKALTPRLYPDNAHGSMGWAIFWISLITLGSDVYRLVAQIWSAVAALRSPTHSSNSAWLPTQSIGPRSEPQSWKDFVALMLGRHQGHAHNSESYDALEEEAMLSEEAQSDAQELDVEKHMQHRPSSRRSDSNSRAGSGSGSPHRVHFVENARGASAESLVQPVDWVGSGSTVVSDAGERGQQHLHGDDAVHGGVLVASPATTACNTPRNSIFGGDSTLLPPVNFKSISLWNKQAEDDKEVSPHHDVPKEVASDSISLTRTRSSRLATLRTVLRYTRVVAARSLPVLAFATSYTGLAVYTGSCRGGYKNVCLAHGIKGGIFFWFGLLTFGRYLGAYADCGWAWNKRPTAQAARNTSRNRSTWRRSMPSAEFVECLVIFVYGASNTWMERFGAAPGDPYTIKQIQHISIAVMFWFAGLMGMLLETKWIRNLLSFPIAYRHVAAVPLHEARRRHRRNASTSFRGVDAEMDVLVEAQTQPASYSASFNPFPALVIGVTGVAMAAHHQDYQYEVEIHMLWGQLLSGFALLRCLTYFLLWLRPPTASVLPSRPPSEALAAFSLCCGGLVFMLSSEEVSFAAMRSGYGDFMAILNVAVAVVALLFCWTTTLMMLKGWAVRREVKRTLGEHGRVESVSSSSNALGLETITVEQEQAPRHMRARATSRRAEPIVETSPVFVLEDEDDEDGPNGQEAANAKHSASV